MITIYFDKGFIYIRDNENSIRIKGDIKYAFDLAINMAKNKNKINFDFNKITDNECCLLNKKIEEYSNQKQIKRNAEELKIKVNELIRLRCFMSLAKFPFYQKD